MNRDRFLVDLLIVVGQHALPRLRTSLAEIQQLRERNGNPNWEDAVVPLEKAIDVLERVLDGRLV